MNPLIPRTKRRVLSLTIVYLCFYNFKQLDKTINYILNLLILI